MPRQFDAGLIPELAALFAQRTRAEWLALLGPADACLEPVYCVDEVVLDPQVRARGLVLEVESPPGQAWRFGSPFPSIERSADTPSPGLGQHTGELLRQAGFDEAEIQELAETSVVWLSSR